MKENRPLFPLRVAWILENEIEEFRTPEEAEMNLEFFDSRDGSATVTDRLGRPVALRVEYLRIVECAVETTRSEPDNEH